MSKRQSVRTPRTPRTPVVSAVTDIASLVAYARNVTVATFAAMLETVNADHGIVHAGRHVARFTAWRVMYAQNFTLQKNAEWQLDDCQLLFVWRALFPMSSGKLFTGSIADGIGIVRGVRADYNRTGHGMPTGKPAIESVSYGAKRFDVAPPAPAPATVATPAPAPATVKRAARKPAARKTA